MRYAIIDLGTNTFNLLIVEINKDRQFTTLFDDKFEAKLGRGGIHNANIVPEAFERGQQCLAEICIIIKKFSCQKTFAFGTSALRNAKNGSVFIDETYKRHNISIQLISGDEEAELIYLGNKQALSIKETILILDIGGGSNEFIIANEKQILWKQSFEIGMQRLLNKFNPSDPICQSDIHEIESYINNELTDLDKALQRFPARTLVGSAGAFDTIRNMIEINEKNVSSEPSFEIIYEDFQYLHKIYTESTQNQLIRIEGMDIMRLEMMPMASVFINFLIHRFSISKLIQSSYSLKEGVLFKYLLN